MKFDFSKDDRTPINVGMYHSEIEANIVKEMKANDGTLICGKFRIDGPSYAGYVLYKNFLIESKMHLDAAYYGRRDCIALLLKLLDSHQTATPMTLLADTSILMSISNTYRQNVIKGFY